MSDGKPSNTLTASLIYNHTNLKISFYLFFAIIFLFAADTFAAVYYLNASTGSDTNPGTSALPWRTIQRALPNYTASPQVTAGDTVMIAPGSYGSFGLSQAVTGRNSYITYKASDPANKPRFTSLSISGTTNAYIKLQDIEIRQSSASSPVYINDSSFIYLQRCDITGYSYTTYGLNIIYADNITFNNCYMGRGAHTLLIRYSQNILMENCEITDSDKDTFYCVDSENITLRNSFIHSPGGGSHSDTVSWTGTNGITVQNCLIYNPVASNEQGLYFTNDFGHRWSNALIENNLIYGNFLGRSVNVEGGDNMTFRNNTCVARTTSSIISNGVAFSGDCTGIQIHNNIFQNTGVTLGSVSASCNIYENLLAGSPGSGSLVNTTVAFANESSNDFTLTANSVAVDFGDSANAPATDLLGNARDAAPDAGCYEYNGGGTPTPRPPVLDPIGDKYVNAGDTLTFEVTAYDPDGDPITYSAEPLPTGAEFIDRTFQWTPTSNQAGTHQLTFTADDGQLQDSETITITVTYTPPQQGNYYVDIINGSDSNPGTSAEPWKTIQRALPNYSGSGAKVAQGSTVTVLPGNYGDITYNENSDTGRTQWITYKAADPSNKPILQDLKIKNTTNAYMIWDGFHIKSLCNDRMAGFCAGASASTNRVTHVKLLNSFVEHANAQDADDYTLSILYADHITIENCEITGGEYNILATYSTNLTFKNIKAHDTLRDCIYLQICDIILIEDSEIYNVDLAGTTAHQDCLAVADCTDVTIRRNKLHDGQSQGLYFVNDFGRNNSNVLIENNLISGYFLGRPLQILDTENLTLRNNTVVAEWTGFPGLDNTGIYVGPNCSNCYIHNNTLQNTGSAFLGSGTYNNYNIHENYKSSNLGANSLDNTTVTFLDEPAADYKLAENSVAVDFGDLANAPEDDLNKMPRDSKPDAGCYEHQQNTSDEGLVGYWQFKEMTGAVTDDSSGSGNSGTLINSPAWTQGRFDGALSFTNTDQAVEITTTDFSLDSGTIVLWANPSNFLSTTQFLFGHVAEGWKNRIQIYTNSADGALGIGLGDTHRRQTGIYNLLTGKWQQITLTWNQGNYAVYVNGARQTQGTYTGLSTISSYADIANTGYQTDRHEAFTGIIDDVRAYSHALTDEEIYELYNLQMWLFEPIGDKTVNENENLTFEVALAEPDNPAVQITAEPLPNGAEFAQPLFNWTPTYEQAGAYDVNFIATNGQIEDIETITITVNNVNRSPALAPLSDKSVDEAATLTFAVIASDPDGDTLILTANPLPAGAAFTADTFQWTPDYDQAGSYTVNFTASDGELQDSQSISITVNNTNRPPVLDEIDDQTIDAGQTLTFTVTASDPDGDTLTLTADPLPAGAAFANGLFEWTPDYDQAGTYTVNFTASDGTLEDSQNVSITITVNSINQPPVLDEIGDKTVYPGQTLKFTLTAADPDGDALTYFVFPLPRGAKFRTDTFTWKPSSKQIGVYNLIVGVSDGELTDRKIITITVRKQGSIPNDITEGLIGYWRLDDGAGSVAADSSDSGNTGALIAAPTWTAGKIKNALQFDTTDQAVEVPTAGANLNQGTVCLWAKPSSFPAVAQFLFGHVAGGWNNRIQIYTNNTSGALGIGLGDTHRKDTGITNLTAGTWYHITLTWQSGSYAVYVNAVNFSQGSYTGLSTLSPYADIANTGNRSDRNEAFNGIIDDVRFYNRALTTDEISTIYTLGNI